MYNCIYLHLYLLRNCHIVCCRMFLGRFPYFLQKRQWWIWSNTSIRQIGAKNGQKKGKQWRFFLAKKGLTTNYCRVVTVFVCLWGQDKGGYFRNKLWQMWSRNTNLSFVFLFLLQNEKYSIYNNEVVAIIIGKVLMMCAALWHLRYVRHTLNWCTFKYMQFFLPKSTIKAVTF